MKIKKNRKFEKFISDGCPFAFTAWVHVREGLIIEYFNVEKLNISPIVDVGDANNEFFYYECGSGLQELFTTNDTGLYFISGRAHSESSVSFYGDYDLEFIVDDVFEKTKCSNFSHLRWVYKNILGLSNTRGTK